MAEQRIQGMTKTDDTKQVTGMNQREAKFVMAYFEEKTIQAAALRAGYAPDTARVNASRWLDETDVCYKPAVHAAIRMKQEAIAEAHMLRIDDLVANLKNVAFNDPLEFFDSETGTLKDVAEMSLAARMCIAEIEQTTLGDNSIKTKIKFRSKDNAIEKLMKYLGGYERNNRQGARSFVVLATPLPESHVASGPGDKAINLTTRLTAQQQNYADLERTNEWVVENNLPDPIVVGD
jgi:phage terminase small subunit